MPPSRPSCRSRLKLGPPMREEKEKKKKFQLVTGLMMIQKFQSTAAAMMIPKCQLSRTSAVRHPNGAWSLTASSLRRSHRIIILTMSCLVVGVAARRAARRRQLGGSLTGLMAPSVLQAAPRARRGRSLDMRVQLRLQRSA